MFSDADHTACQKLPPNKGLQRTARGADKIGAILKAGIGSTAFPIYDCAAAEAQIVGRHYVICLLLPG
jgi:hypothetical protein